MADTRIESEDETISPAQLAREVRVLRARLDSLQTALGEQRRLTLQARRQQLFLGQPAAIVATLTDAAGTTPQVDVPVTFVATWGRLRAERDLQRQQGSTITVRTGADGTARVALLPPTSEDLLDEQQAALEAMLDLLDPSTGQPGAVVEGLRELARQYRWEAGTQFRQAVDIYLRDFRPQLLDTVNRADFMVAWLSFDAVVLAFAREEPTGPLDDAGNTSVAGSAALTLRFKDWLGPWLETYLALSQAESDLANDLRDVRQRGGDAGAILTGIHQRVRDYVSRQYGMAGEYAGRRIVDQSFQRFVESEANDLPLDTRVTLFPTLEAGAGTIVSGGFKALAAVSQTQSTLRKELQTKLTDIPVGNIGGLKAQLDDLQSRLGSKLDAAAFQDFRTAVDTRLATKLDTAAFTGFQGQVKGALAGKADVAALDGFRSEVGTALGAKADRTDVDKLKTDLPREIAGLRDDSDQLKRAISSLNTTVRQLTRDVQELKDRLRPG